MNLGKLLAAGKSWMNGSAEISYRVDKQFYLPKFGMAKNPLNPAPRENAAPKKEAPAQKNAALPTPPAKPAAKPAASWVNKLSPASAFRPQPDAKNLPAVQAELSLDAVKVVNNDLTDADVEVVPLKSRSPAMDLPPAKKSWEILGERLLKATAL